ncbi:Histone-binding protein MSI1 [Acorus calamus]|uniref:Histone-binding protein MSI1 n=1 Tax=Acorus calamus TaxID=4465 RepID=A0AAV9FAW8_ACOCL|nr:Histone-binding protein MSI1 [Acorus calamus]
MVLGAHTSGDGPNLLMVAEVQIPISDEEEDDDDTGVGVPANPEVFRLNHEGVIAKHPMEPEEETCNPDVVLRGHTEEGYGLSWTPLKEGCLLSGSDDGKICLWDISAMPQDKALDPQGVYEVNCLAFHPFNEWVVATTLADATIKLFDLRNLSESLHIFVNHTEPVFHVEWSPNRENIFASSAADQKLMVWDLFRVGGEQAEKKQRRDHPSSSSFTGVTLH